jgi:hypothetical protein
MMMEFGVLTTTILAIWGGSTFIVSSVWIGCLCSERIKRSIMG